MRLRHAVVSAPLMMLFSGCGGESIHADTPNSVSAARLASFSGGQQSVEVLGGPPDGATPAMIAATIRNPGGARSTRFEVSEPGGSGSRLVLEFGVSSAGVGSCATPRGSDGGAFVVTATLCSGQRPLRTATMRSDTLKGPSSREFQGAMDRLMLALLTPQQQSFRREY